MKGTANQVIIGYIAVALSIVIMVVTGSYWWLIAILFFMAFARGAEQDMWFDFLFFLPMEYIPDFFSGDGSIETGDTGYSGDDGTDTSDI